MGIDRLEVVRMNETRPVDLRVVVDIGDDGQLKGVTIDRDLHVQVLFRADQLMIQGDFKPALVDVHFRRKD